MSLPNRTRAVVTGGAGGLGRAFCIELAKRKARLTIGDLRAEAAEGTAKIARSMGAEAHAVACDVSRAADVELLAVEADARYGGTDLLVNNAGVAVAGEVGATSLEDWQWIMGINLWGVIYGCHSFVPRMKKQGSGHVLNVASAAGLLTAPTMGPYNVTKAGVVALSETLYGELHPLGLGCTVLCPTFFKTDIAKNARGATMDGEREFVEKLMAKSKLDANDVARIALEAADARRLYALPHADGRWMWRAKRLAPQAFYQQVSKVAKKMRERA
jgi:NAD(P)-dependent dehydrogenase (short-subunit alcohol dehydrogenase family)